MPLGRRYSVEGQRACAASAPQTVIHIMGGTGIRPCIYDFFLGSSATPADNSILWFFQRSTAAGTGSGTPAANVLDPGDPATPTTAPTKAHTTDPTYTSNILLMRLALNQRATHRANLDPNGPLVCTVASNNGIGLYATHASFTGNIDGTVWFYE